MRRVTHVADALPSCANPTPGESSEARGRVAASRPIWLPLDAYFSDRLWLAALAAAPKEGFSAFDQVDRLLPRFQRKPTDRADPGIVRFRVTLGRSHASCTVG